MLDVQEFFQHQVTECLALAKGSVHKEDRKFWEESARRWGELLTRKRNTPSLARLIRPQDTESTRGHPGDGTNQSPQFFSECVFLQASLQIAAFHGSPNRHLVVRTCMHARVEIIDEFAANNACGRWRGDAAQKLLRMTTA
jgi:hypothetical protein